MKKKLTAFIFCVILLLTLCACSSGAGDPFAKATELIGSDVEALYEAIGRPDDVMYASSCLGEGEDGELYYDGFTVYTYRDTDGSESVYDVMENDK